MSEQSKQFDVFLMPAWIIAPPEDDDDDDDALMLSGFVVAVTSVRIGSCCGIPLTNDTGHKELGTCALSGSTQSVDPVIELAN